LTLKREWKSGDTIACVFDMAPRLVLGDHENEGRVAVMYGPLVLALDQASNKSPIDSLTIAAPSSGAFALEHADDSAVFKANGLTLTPYYAAGLDKSPFNIWIKKAS
jgi:DUF1680 family protein